MIWQGDFMLSQSRTHRIVCRKTVKAHPYSSSSALFCVPTRIVHAKCTNGWIKFYDRSRLQRRRPTNHRRRLNAKKKRKWIGKSTRWQMNFSTCAARRVCGSAYPRTLTTDSLSTQPTDSRLDAGAFSGCLYVTRDRDRAFALSLRSFKT